MSREKDFIEAAERLAETKRTEDAKQQCLYDFGIAAEYGYQYAVEKACEWLESLSGYVVCGQKANVENFRKAMEL